jgi:hypothetical protein
LSTTAAVNFCAGCPTFLVPVLTDIYFLTGLGDAIAGAVELKRALQGMAAAVDVQEMNHRTRTGLPPD